MHTYTIALVLLSVGCTETTIVTQNPSPIAAPTKDAQIAEEPDPSNEEGTTEEPSAEDGGISTRDASSRKDAATGPISCVAGEHRCATGCCPWKNLILNQVAPGMRSVPRAITTDAQGNVWIPMANSNEIGLVHGVPPNLTYEPIESGPIVDERAAIAVDSAGLVYLAYVQWDHTKQTTPKIRLAKGRPGNFTKTTLYENSTDLPGPTDSWTAPGLLEATARGANVAITFRYTTTRANNTFVASGAGTLSVEPYFETNSDSRGVPGLALGPGGERHLLGYSLSRYLVYRGEADSDVFVRYPQDVSFVSLAFDRQDNLHAFYHDTELGSVVLAKKGPTGWRRQEIESPSTSPLQYGTWGELGIGEQGPEMVYMLDLSFFHVTSTPTGLIKSEVLIPSGQRGIHLGFAVGGTSKPYPYVVVQAIPSLLFY